MEKRPPAQKFEDLVVWQKAHAMVLRVYRDTKPFPKEEMYGLVSQMRRAAVSVPANIAEGFKRRGRSDKARMMNVAQGSLEELKYYYVLSRDLGYLKEANEREQIEEVSRLLGAYAQKILSSAF